MSTNETDVPVMQAKVGYLIESLAGVAAAGAKAMEERDAARNQAASLRHDLRDRRTGYALDEWLLEHNANQKGAEWFRGEEELAEMSKLRTWWTESDGENRTDYFVWREPVTADEGRRVLELWGFDPEAHGCACAGDCCGHWFSNGVYVVNGLLWIKPYARNV